MLSTSDRIDSIVPILFEKVIFIELNDLLRKINTESRLSRTLRCFFFSVCLRLTENNITVLNLWALYEQINIWEVHVDKTKTAGSSCLATLTASSLKYFLMLPFKKIKKDLFLIMCICVRETIYTWVLGVHRGQRCQICSWS